LRLLNYYRPRLISLKLKPIMFSDVKPRGSASSRDSLEALFSSLGLGLGLGLGSESLGLGLGLGLGLEGYYLGLGIGLRTYCLVNKSRL